MLTISNSTNTKLQMFAKTMTLDTDSAINFLLSLADLLKQVVPENIVVSPPVAQTSPVVPALWKPYTAPELTHSRPYTAKINQRVVNISTWIDLFSEILSEAISNGGSLSSVPSGNVAMYQKNNNGWKDIGSYYSIRRMNANNTWFECERTAKHYKITVEVWFQWNHNAINAGATGHLKA